MAEAQLSFLRMLEAMPCGAVILDEQHRIIHASRQLLNQLQCPAGDLMHRSLEDLCAEQIDSKRIAGYLDELRQGQKPAQHTEVDWSIHPGQVRPMMLQIQPLHLPANGTPQLAEARWLVSVMDISAQRDTYEQISKLSNTVLEQAVALKRYSQSLEESVAQRTDQLRQANMETIYMLAVACEAKDDNTGEHVRRIESYSHIVAEACGMCERDAKEIGYSAILHDVGKIHVPDYILKKPHRLNPDERHQMEEHTIVGEMILGKNPFFATARLIARSHHENWDGSGYPDKLKGEEIPLPARIVHLVDVFDALSTRRVYKSAWSLEETLNTIYRDAGKLFDPHLVDVFQGVVKSGVIEDIRAGLCDIREAGNRVAM